MAEKKYLIDNSTLMAEWDWEKNNNLGFYPDKMTCGSNKKVWWLCPKNEKHEWQAVINSRNNSVGCPYCSNRKILLGYNDLASQNSKLAKEWHPTKNGKLTPKDVTYGSNKKVWWKCDICNYEWQAAINDRNQGRGCACCANKVVIIGYNDLATTRPDIAKEWHPTKNGNLTPKDVTAGSDKKVWWICGKGHEWQTQVYNRKRKGCAKCSSELKTSFPEQVIFYYFSKITATINRYMVDSNTEIDVYLPNLRIGIEYDGSYYHKGKKAEERELRKEEKLSKLNIRLIRVKEVSNNEDLEIINNIIYTKTQHTNYSLTKMMQNLLYMVNQISNFTFNIEIDIENDRIKINEQYIQMQKEKSLAVVNPELASEWHPTKNGKLRPEHFTESSNKKVWWQGKCGHEWQAIICDRKHKGCSICAGKKVLLGYNDLQTKYPELASEWHPTKNGNLTPNNITYGSNKKVWWLGGECKHEWQDTISHRTSGRNCSVCASKKLIVGVNDLASQNSQLAREWNYEKNGTEAPRDYMCGSNAMKWWTCEKCGFVWEARINDRNKGNGCPKCAGNKVLIGVNDLATANSTLAKEWCYEKNGKLTPQKVKATSSKSVWWKCNICNNIWLAKIKTRNLGGNNCKKCK